MGAMGSAARQVAGPMQQAVRDATAAGPADPNERLMMDADLPSGSGHVWTAPGWQELFSREQQVVGAAMCSAC